MLRLPDALHCIIAEQVRAEVGNKSTLLGFYGIAPDVQIFASAIPAQMNLCALLLCKAPRVSGTMDASIEVYGPIGQVLPRTRVALPDAVEGVRVSCAFNFGYFPIPSPGEYKIVVFTRGEVHSEHVFTIVAGTIATEAKSIFVKSGASL